MASIPNPLFDLAGLTCGHVGVRFSTFFAATLLGKAVIKAVLLQGGATAALFAQGDAALARLGALLPAPLLLRLRIAMSCHPAIPRGGGAPAGCAECCAARLGAAPAACGPPCDALAGGGGGGGSSGGGGSGAGYFTLPNLWALFMVLCIASLLVSVVNAVVQEQLMRDAVADADGSGDGAAPAAAAAAAAAADSAAPAAPAAARPASASLGAVASPLSLHGATVVGALFAARDFAKKRSRSQPPPSAR
jgi:hypothetical protein